MNVMQLMQLVLDETYAAIAGREDEKDAKIRRALQGLRDKYGSLLLEGPPIDYTSPETRFAYLHSYIASHAHLVADRLEASPSLRELFEQPQVQVACIGGGPGTELLGLLKYCIEKQKSLKLRCLLFDKTQEWSESWEDVDKKLGTDISLYTTYQTIDVTDPKTWQFRQKYLQQTDLFTLVYFMSEVYRFAGQASPYFVHLFQGARPGALFLYIDNNRPEFTDWFERLATENGLEIISSGDRPKECLPADEEKRDLGVYFSKFGSPKITANIAFRIARKQ